MDPKKAPFSLVKGEKLSKSRGKNINRRLKDTYFLKNCREKKDYVYLLVQEDGVLSGGKWKKGKKRVWPFLKHFPKGRHYMRDKRGYSIE